MKPQSDASQIPVKISVQIASDGIVIPVWAQPGARKNAILGVTNAMLKIAVTAPPEDGRANAAIAELLAKQLGVSKSRVQLLSGTKHRHKKFLLVGIEADALQVLLS